VLRVLGADADADDTVPEERFQFMEEGSAVRPSGGRAARRIVVPDAGERDTRHADDGACPVMRVIVREAEQADPQILTHSLMNMTFPVRR
jgi:hypothetical protein